MTTDDVITGELAERVERLLGEYAGSLPPGAGQAFARRARELGVALVDPDRHRCLVDETVYAGALYRLRRVEAELAEVKAGGEVGGDFQGCEPIAAVEPAAQ